MEFEKLEFKDMVDIVAHDAAMQLMRGTSWRSIIHLAITSALQWRLAQDEAKKKTKAS